MKIFRLVLLAVAIALIGVNLWSINYQESFSSSNIWAYVRILCAIVLIVILVIIIRRSSKGNYIKR